MADSMLKPKLLFVTLRRNVNVQAKPKLNSPSFTQNNYCFQIDFINFGDIQSTKLLSHMMPKQKRLYWPTFSVTNLKQHQASKFNHNNCHKDCIF
jgi:hypothetical protein